MNRQPIHGGNSFSHCWVIVGTDEKNPPTGQLSGFRWGPCVVILPSFSRHQENDALLATSATHRAASRLR